MAPREVIRESRRSPASDVRVPKMRLPAGVVTRTHVGSLSQEAESIDNFLTQAAIRQPGSSLQLPKTSRLFDELVSVNQLNMLHAADRKLIGQFLLVLRTKAPTLHISFNNDPSALFLNKLVVWLRQNIHPFLLIRIGLQPNIGAGCVVRTTNKYFDFSMKQLFDNNRELLISKLQGPIENTQNVESVDVKENAS